MIDFFFLFRVRYFPFLYALSMLEDMNMFVEGGYTHNRAQATHPIWNRFD
jgi:hypothetical protein